MIVHFEGFTNTEAFKQSKRIGSTLFKRNIWTKAYQLRPRRILKEHGIRHTSNATPAQTVLPTKTRRSWHVEVNHNTPISS